MNIFLNRVAGQRTTLLLTSILLLTPITPCYPKPQPNGGPSSKSDSISSHTPSLEPLANPSPTPDVFTVESFQLTRGSERDLKVSLASGRCSANAVFDTKDKVIDQEQIKSLARAGIIISRVETSNCDLVFTIAIEPTAEFRERRIKLQYKTGDVVDKESIAIELIDEPPTPPGAIPAGMKPEVDIMWSVVPQKITKDNFGARVGKLFYCIEVVIGNNTGYDLQIASVGFHLGPVGEAATTMSTTYKAVTKEMSRQQKEKIRTLLASSDTNCSGTTEQVIKCQNQRLADLAKGLNEINNSQTAVVGAVREQARMLTQLSRVAYGQKLPVSSYTMARGSIEHGRFLSFRNLGVNFLKSLGPVLTGFTPFFHVLNHRANYSEGINILSNPIEKGFEALVPDETVDQMQRLDDQILRDGMIIQNNRQIRTRVFIPKDLLRLDGSLRDDPMMVTQALGDLYLIGDSIKFINRVSVSSAGSGEIIPPPTINPTSIVLDLDESKATQVINLTGTNLTGALVTSTDPNIVVSSHSSTRTSVHAEIKVKDTATPGSKTLNITTPSGTVPVIITVKLPPPTISSPTVVEDPAFVSFRPEKVESERTLIGSFLQQSSIKPAQNNTQVTARVAGIDAAGKSIKVVFTVPAGLDIGSQPSADYGFDITNPDNPTTPARVTVRVKRRGNPEVSVDASNAVPFASSDAKSPKRNPSGETPVTLRVSGNNLNDLHQTSPIVQKAGENPRFAITGESVIPISDKEVQVKLVVPKDTPAGDYHFMLNNNKGDTSNEFVLRVEQQDGLTIPKEEERNQTLTIADNGTATITFNGSNLDGAKLVPGTVPSGWGITISQSSTPTQLVLNVKAPSSFADGPVGFKLTNTNDDPTKAVDIVINAKHPAVPTPPAAPPPASPPTPPD